MRKQRVKSWRRHIRESRIEAWEQQPGEPDGDFLKFQAYLELPRRGDRTIYGAYRAFMGSNANETGKPPGSWFTRSDNWQWKARAQACYP